jgi:hypothetical protein
MRTVLACVIVAMIAAQSQTPPANQTIFRTRTDLVTVDVSVRSQGTPVAGLGPKDFVLLDNGVRQTIEKIDDEAVPVDVSILVDMNEDMSDDIKGMSAQLPRMIALLRPSDRLRVMAINTYVSDLIPAQPAANAPSLGRFVVSGISSAHDGLAAALLRKLDPNRRHLIIALTNGIDAVSALDAAAVRDIARRSSATLHIAQIDVAIDAIGGSEYLSGRERLDRHRCQFAKICQPVRRYWQPYDEHEFETLGEAADLTGGKLHLPGVFTDRTAAAIFKNVFDDYRRSYLLRYVPTGVKREGWHEITVTIPAHRYEVQARRGYNVEASRPPREAAAAPTPPFLFAHGRMTADDIVQAYGQGDYEMFVAGLRQSQDLSDLIRDIQAAGSPWPGRPSREAVFVLEVADVGLQSTRAEDREAARRLLLAHRQLIRHPLGPNDVERYWLWAALLLLEGANQPDIARTFVDDALIRFPNEPRFVLARAFIADQRATIAPAGGRGSAPSAEAVEVRVNGIAAAYDEAMAFGETAAEARVRKGWLLFRAGRREEGLALLDAAVASPREPDVGYYRQLLRGHVLEALGRLDAAIDAYRAAIALAPAAPSPQVRLMAALQRKGDFDGARAMAETIQTGSADALDPWWWFWRGDYRLSIPVFTRLREQGR